MAKPKQIITGKVRRNTSKNFTIEKAKDTELDADIAIEDDGTYDVDKLSVDGLPETIDGLPPSPDGKNVILWFNNFSIKQNGQYINQSFKVKIKDLSAVKAAGKNIIIWDGNTNNGKPWVFPGDVIDDTIELTDGDPGIGMNPP